MQISEVYNTSAIAAFRSESPSNKIPFLGLSYFPIRRQMGIDLKWIKTHKGLGVALKPSNFDAIPTVRPRGSAKITQEEMPLFRESILVKEHDMIEIARAQNSNDPFLPPILDTLYNDANNLIDGGEISVECMRMQLLAPKDGKMEINIGMADNTLYSYSYDKDESWKHTNYLELTESDTWDKPDTSKPLSDIRKAVRYLSSIGVVATGIIGNSTTFDYLMENKQIKNAMVSMTGQAIDYIDDQAVQKVISRQMKLDSIVYDKMYTDYDGTQKKFYPDNYVTILGSGQLGSTWMGTTPEELTTLDNFALDIPQAPVDIRVLPNGIAVAIQNEYKPSFTVTTTASEIALPSFEGMDSIFVIKVKEDE